MRSDTVAKILTSGASQRFLQSTQISEAWQRLYGFPVCVKLHEFWTENHTERTTMTRVRKRLRLGSVLLMICTSTSTEQQTYTFYTRLTFQSCKQRKVTKTLSCCRRLSIRTVFPWITPPLCADIEKKKNSIPQITPRGAHRVQYRSRSLA